MIMHIILVNIYKKEQSNCKVKLVYKAVDGMYYIFLSNVMLYNVLISY